MGKPRIPRKVKFFIICLSADDCLFDVIRIHLENEFGTIETAGPIHSWNYSPAYTEELGKNIHRRFFVFKELSDRELLVDWKISTNRLEQKFSHSPTTSIQRRVNLDPGYVSGSQVILASTKQYKNRVYLREGIYADLTLYFDGKTFLPLKGLTFPDYQTRATIRFFNQLRETYLEQSESMCNNSPTSCP